MRRHNRSGKPNDVMDTVALAVIWSILLAFFGALGFAVLGIEEDPDKEDQEYCEMVELYKSSDGEFGWPPYRGDTVSCPVEVPGASSGPSAD